MEHQMVLRCWWETKHFPGSTLEEAKRRSPGGLFYFCSTECRQKHREFLDTREPQVLGTEDDILEVEAFMGCDWCNMPGDP